MSAESNVFDLESNTPKLRLLREWKDTDGKPTEQVWEISFPDGRPPEVYLDASNDVRRIRSWVANRCRLADQKWRSSALLTLVVSGLIKTGKSYTLNEVVPAVLAEAMAREPPEHPLKGIRVLRLNCLKLDRMNGAGMMMYDLLGLVVEWAAEADMWVNDRELHKAQAVLADASNGVDMYRRAGRAMAELFERGFQTPVLVLMDELQALLQPTTMDGGRQEELARGEAAFIRDVVLREILISAPPHVLWAVTGSSMALVWMSLAAMPVNGTAPLNQIKTVHLPASVPPHLMQELMVHASLRRRGLPQLQELKQPQQAVGQVEQPQQAVGQVEQPQQAVGQVKQPQQAVGQVEQPRQALGQVEQPQQAVGQVEQPQQAEGQIKTLLERSGNSPALFITMLDAAKDSDMDITTFVDEFMQNKLFGEALKEWSLALAYMSDEDRCRVLDLANVALGASIDTFPDQDIWRFLKPYMLQTEHGRYYLADPMQRLLLRAVIERGGKLRKSFTGLGQGLTLAQLDLGWMLLQLGEVADYVVGQRRPPKGFPSHVKGTTDLTIMLKGFASKVAQLPAAEGASTADRWEGLTAFKEALDSTYNKGSSAWYTLEGKDKKLQNDLDYLVFFLRLCRNVLAHHWQQQGLLNILQVMVMALPTILGVSAQALAEQVRICMSQLEPDTIMAAAAAADAEEEGVKERASPASPASNSSAGIGSAPSTGRTGSASGVAGVSSASSSGSASGLHPSASAPNASASALSNDAGASASAMAPSFNEATGTGIGSDTTSAGGTSTRRANSPLTGLHASSSGLQTGASAPTAGGASASKKRGGRRRRRKMKHSRGDAGSGADPASGGGTPAVTGGCRPGSSCLQARPALSGSGVPVAALRCLLAGNTVVPHTLAMLPVVRRLGPMRITTG